MTPDAWELPGPTAFLDEAIGGLREGATVVLHVPEHGPGGCREALQRSVRRDGLLSFRRAELRRPEEVPAETVAAALGVEPGDPCFTGPEALAQSKSLAGSVLWIESVRGYAWPAWRTFLNRFAHAARAFPVGDCGQLCVMLMGDIPSGGVDLDPGLRRVAWRDRMSRLDVQLELVRGWNARAASSLERDLRIALAVELAGYDLEFAARLVRGTLVQLLSPRAHLTEEAAARNWSGRCPRDGWGSGRIDQLDGKAFEHAASLAAAGKVDEIQRRVWRAELGIVFPWLEERRIEIVRALRHVLTPMESRFGYVERIEDLELAHILWQIRTKRRGLEWEQKLEGMNNLRRALAHLEPVDPEDLVRAGLLDRAVLGRAA